MANTAGVDQPSADPAAAAARVERRPGDLGAVLSDDARERAQHAIGGDEDELHVAAVLGHEQLAVGVVAAVTGLG